MKLTDLLNEGSDWRGKDIVVMQKAHERVLRSTAALQKAVVALDKLSKKNANKPNGIMFVKESKDMLTAFQKAVMPGSRFWTKWEEYKKGGEAAFPNDWNTSRKTRS